MRNVACRASDGDDKTVSVPRLIWYRTGDANTVTALLVLCFSDWSGKKNMWIDFGKDTSRLVLLDIKVCI